MADIARLNEAALASIGMDRATVAGLRHIARQVGMAMNGATLPDLAAQSDLSQSSLDSLRIAITTLRALGAALEAEQAETIAPDRYARRIAELETALESVRFTNNNLARRLATLENGVN